MNTERVTALVSGANRGLGRQFAAELLNRGAKVYAGAATPRPSALRVSPRPPRYHRPRVAKLALNGLFAGEPEIFADDLTRIVRAQLSTTA